MLRPLQCVAQVQAIAFKKAACRSAVLTVRVQAAFGCTVFDRAVRACAVFAHALLARAVIACALLSCVAFVCTVRARAVRACAVFAHALLARALFGAGSLALRKYASSIADLRSAFSRLGLACSG